MTGAYGFLVITADKGLAGAYNQNVLKEAQRMLAEHPEDNKIFVIGEYGRQYFAARSIPIEKEFLYTAQNPTLQRARNITALLLDLYRKGELSGFLLSIRIWAAWSPPPRRCACSAFHRSQFASASHEKRTPFTFEFSPSVEEALDSMIPSYVSGFIYSALGTASE